MPALPPVVWAERPDLLLVTVQLVDAKDVKLNLSAEKLDFTATQDGKEWALTLDFKGEIDVEGSTHTVHARAIEMKLKKKEEGPYWESLTKQKARNIKVDWAKWKDEDEVDSAENLGDFGAGGDFMSQMGGMGGMGMPGFQPQVQRLGPGPMPGFPQTLPQIQRPLAPQMQPLPGTMPQPIMRPPPMQQQQGEIDPGRLATMSAEQQKNLLGEKLFAKVATVDSVNAAKITGMLLEMDNSEIINLIDSPPLLASKVQEAIDVLRQHTHQSQH
eukprot:TRINITY_DN1435_c0_g1_i1.p2 TRINITY_DN1435_c0_g1~~TRINITY_DN1435_c0_g1_i1.p2  ORF type:complete len:272 (+),score=112.92 TRINITY_DN1435_c0_g1_i1:69-884(+)